MNLKYVTSIRPVNLGLTLCCHYKSYMVEEIELHDLFWNIYWPWLECWVMYWNVSFCILISVQLQHHARHRLPTFQLIFVHVIESLVFVPVSMQLLLVIFYSLYPILSELTCLLILYPDNDWNTIFSIWVLWWSAFGFHGLDSCLDLWTLHAYQVVPFP